MVDLGILLDKHLFHVAKQRRTNRVSLWRRPLLVGTRACELRAALGAGQRHVRAVEAVNRQRRRRWLVNEPQHLQPRSR